MSIEYDQEELDAILKEELSSASGSEDLEFNPDDLDDSPRAGSANRERLPHRMSMNTERSKPITKRSYQSDPQAKLTNMAHVIEPQPYRVDENIDPNDSLLDESGSDDEKPQEQKIPSEPLDLVEYRFRHAIEKEKTQTKESEAVELFFEMHEEDDKVYEQLAELEVKPDPSINSFFAGENPKYGKMSAFDVYEKSLMVIGTNKALILVFDLISKNTNVISKSRQMEYDKVSSLTVAEGAEFLISGYGMGQVTIWDLKVFEPIQNILGVFISNVELVRVIQPSTFGFISADSSGLLIYFSLSKNFLRTTVNQQVIFKKDSTSKGRSLHRVLLVSWGTIVCTYCVQPDNTSPGRFYAEKLMTVKLTEVVRNVGWITSSLITLYTNKYRIVAVGNRSIVAASQLDLTEKDFIYHVDLKIMPTDNYSSDYLSKQIKLMENQKTIYVFTNGQLLSGTILSYRQAILKMVDAGRWKNALDLCIKIYQGEYEYLGDVPASAEQKKSILHPFIKEIVVKFMYQANQYRRSQANSAKSELDMDNVIAVCLHTLVSIGSFESIFYDLKNATTELGLKDGFYEQLEPYLLMGKIKWAPPADIKRICEIYSKKDRSVVIKNFLLNLSVESFEYNFLQAVCMENGLHYPLIYICTQSIYEDYITPALKIYREFSDARLVFDQINETKFGHLTLWYMRMILHGECLGKPIKQAMLPPVVLQLAVMFWTEQFFSQLLAFDCKLVLSVYRLYFIMPNIDYINNKDFKDTITVKTLKTSTDLPTQMRHYLHYLLTVKATKYGINSSSVINTFYLFECSLMPLKHVDFDHADLERIIDSQLKDIEDIEDDANSLYSLSDKEEDLNSQPSPVTMCLRYHPKAFTTQELEALEARMSPAMHEEELAEIKSLEGDFYKAYDILYSANTKSKRRKVFSWFEYYLTKASTQDEDYIRELLVSQTKNLVALNTEKTQDLLLKFCKDKQIQAARELAPWPNIQYEFLRDLVNEKDFSLLNSEVKLIYLEIMCQIDFYKVPDEIRAHEYPLEEALKTCKRFNHTEAIIAINERMGRVTEAMELFLERYQKMGYLDKANQMKFEKDIKVFDGLLVKVYEMGQDDTKVMLIEKILERLSLAIPYGVKPEWRNLIVGKLVKVMLYYLSGQFVYSEANYNRVKALIGTISLNLTLGDLKTFLITVLHEMGMDINIEEEYKELVDEVATNENQQTVVSKESGTKAQTNTCFLCHTRLAYKLDQNILFQCGHCFHIHCIDKNRCPFCNHTNEYGNQMLVEREKKLDVLDISKLLQWNAEFVADSLRTGVGFTTEVTKQTGEFLLNILSGTAQAMASGASLAFGDRSEENRIQMYRALEQEREKYEMQMKGKITKMSDLMEPDVFEIRMIEKMNYVDSMMHETYRDLTDEVDDFARNVNEKFSISRLKFVGVQQE